MATNQSVAIVDDEPLLFLIVPSAAVKMFRAAFGSPGYMMIMREV
jgi:hypothetical protein